MAQMAEGHGCPATGPCSAGGLRNGRRRPETALRPRLSKTPDPGVRSVLARPANPPRESAPSSGGGAFTTVQTSGPPIFACGSAGRPTNPRRSTAQTPYRADPGDSANVMMVSVAMTVTYCRPFTA